MSKIGENVSTTIKKIRKDSAKGFSTFGNGLAKGINALKNANTTDLAQTAFASGLIVVAAAYASSLITPENSAIATDAITNIYSNISDITNNVVTNAQNALDVAKDLPLVGGAIDYTQRVLNEGVNNLASLIPNGVKDVATSAKDSLNTMIAPEAIVEGSTRLAKCFIDTTGAISAGFTSTLGLAAAENATNGGVTRAARKGKELTVATVEAVKELKQNGR